MNKCSFTYKQVREYIFKKCMMLNIKSNKPKSFLPYLIILLGLFVFRVLAQLLQYKFNLSFLPPFQSWDSGTLPYGILIALQLTVVFVLSKTIYKIALHKVKPNLKTVYIFVTLGTLYFAIMLFRLIAGLTLLHDLKWFLYPIPSFFHLILASFLILFGYFHLSNIGGEIKHG